MKRYKNRGFSKPAVLASAVLLAAAGGGASWYFLNQSSDSTFSHIEDESTRNLINNVDMSSPISVASALQNTLITNNYTGTDILVNRLRELEFAEKTGKPITSMTKEQKETQVDISSYLVPAAVESVENKIKQLNRDLNSKISPASYEETLNGLTSIFKFFSPKSAETQIIASNITAYNAYKSHPDYMISDIRAMYGPYDALAVCRYLIGLEDYSRLSAQELLDHIVRESRHLIKQIPIQISDKPKHYSVADFTEINTRKLYDLSDIYLHLPNVMSYVLLINDPSILPQQREKAFASLQEAFETRLTASQNLLFRAKTYFQCQATTSTSFGVEIKRLNPVVRNVSKLGTLTLNASRANLVYPLKGCANMESIYILYPDSKEYEDLMARSERKMSDEEREMVKRDIALLKKFEAGEKNIAASITASDIAATESHLELNPEQGYFIGKKPSSNGMLFNLMLPSTGLLRALNINPDADPIFTENIQSVHKRKQAIYKLGLVEDYSLIENSLAELDFTKLAQDSYNYIIARNEKEKDIIKLSSASEYAMNTRGYDSTGGTAVNTTTGPDTNNDTVTSVSDLTSVNAEDDGMHTITVTTAVENTESTSNETPDGSGLNEIATSAVGTPAENEAGTNVVATSENVATTEEPAIVIEAPATNTASKDVNETTKDEGQVLATTEVATTTPEAEVKSEEANKEASTNETTNVVASTEEPTSEAEVSAPKFMDAAKLRKAKVAQVEADVKNGSSDAMVELAIRYIGGINGVKRDHKKAAQLLQKAQGLTDNKRVDALLGSLYCSSPVFTSKDKKAGAQMVVKAAADGAPEAYGVAGTMLLEGEYIKQDYQKALQYLSLAADNDDRNAQYQLATMYLDGNKGVARSPEKAYPLLTNASKTVPNAAYLLAELVRGNELPNAHDEALTDELYIQAAARGVKNAYKYAGLAILKTGNGKADVAINKYLADYKNKGDKEVDEVLLSYYIKKNDRTEIAKLIASDPKEYQAQFPVETAKLYVKGAPGHKRDLKKAEEFYRKGIAANIPEAYCGLGDLFLYEPEHKHDVRAGIGNYTKGAELGAYDCIKGLGIVYSTELYHTRYNEAYGYISKAAALRPNDTLASGLKALMQAYGMGIQKNEKSAQQLMKNIKGSSIINGVYLLLEGDALRMQQVGCTSTFLALASGLKSGNKAWYAYATMSDLLAYGDYLKKGGAGSFDNIKFEAGKVCRNVPVTIMHDVNGFKFTTDNSTPEKQYENAMALFAGNGVKKDYEAAYKLMEQAASQNYTKALNNLGIFQLFGIGTTAFHKNTFSNLVQAASKGDAQASLSAAAARKFGWGGTKADSNKAQDMIYTATTRGNKAALEHLYYGSHYGSITGFKKSDEQAFRFIALSFINEQKAK